MKRNSLIQRSRVRVSNVATRLRWGYGRRVRRWIGVGLLLITLFAVLPLGGLIWKLESEGNAPLDPTPFLAVQASPELQDRQGVLLHAFLNPAEQWVFPREREDFSPWLIRATLSAEDQRFYRHHGVDYRAVLRAVLQNLRQGGVASGASTLSMQVVKLALPLEGDAPTSTRSLEGKWWQAVTALQLERQVDKDTLLTAYLNKAPYGQNLVGAEAAARRYFGKSARSLSLEEAALLAGLPKAPSYLHPLSHPERAQARRDYVLRRMYRDGYIDASRLKSALDKPLGAAWRDFPQHAPHLAHYHRSGIEAAGQRRSTLDRHLQDYCERVVKQYMNNFAGEVTNAAVMVADVARGEVLVRVGSADFAGGLIGGQVDLSRALRAPGSTLKPFTYALALDRNRLYPSELLLDDTLDYGAYSPGNFDGRFNGLVTATEALHYSLNIPAVMLLERTGIDSLITLMQAAGLTTLTEDAEHYGLGLTLGNCEVRLEEMMAAYTAIAHEGIHRPLRQWITDTALDADSAQRIISRGAAQSLYRMLEAPFPREVRRDLVRTQGVLPRVAWKTGTSTGYHDAWTFAFNKQYVVGVWLGNNDARSSRRLVGAEAALPLAARIFRALPNTGAAFWPPMDALRTVRVCADSGLPVSDWCPHSQETAIPEAQYVNRRCAVHYPDAHGQVAQRWPGAPRRWNLARIENPVQVAWADNPATENARILDIQSRRATRQETLRITSPAPGATYIHTQTSGGDTIQLGASGQGSAPLHWYLNDRYLGASTHEAPLFLELAPGAHKLTCFSDSGHEDQVHFEVLHPARQTR